MLTLHDSTKAAKWAQKNLPEATFTQEYIPRFIKQALENEDGYIQKCPGFWKKPDLSIQDSERGTRE